MRIGAGAGSSESGVLSQPAIRRCPGGGPSRSGFLGLMERPNPECPIAKGSPQRLDGEAGRGAPGKKTPGEKTREENRAEFVAMEFVVTKANFWQPERIAQSHLGKLSCRTFRMGQLRSRVFGLVTDPPEPFLLNTVFVNSVPATPSVLVEPRTQHRIGRLTQVFV